MTNANRTLLKAAINAQKKFGTDVSGNVPMFGSTPCLTITDESEKVILADLINVAETLEEAKEIVSVFDDAYTTTGRGRNGREVVMVWYDIAYII